MRFGPTPLDDAESAILAHGFRLPGRVLKKGRRLTAEDVAALRDAGYREVVAARLDPDDVAENDAARELAEVLAGDGPGAGAVGGSGLAAGNAFTGRCNLFAAVRGLLCVDEARLEAVNAVGEELTVATLPPATVVDPRRLAATVKVIPFAVRRAHLDECLRLVRAHDGAILRVAEFRPRRAGIVLTTLPGTAPALLDKTAAVLRDKLAGVGASLEAERRCAHTVEAVAAGLRELVAAGCELVLVLGASAVADRRDVVPAAIEAAGGTVERLGLPVDPGNLCLTARLGAAPVVGLPGSSRSPAAGGADLLLLQRIGAGLPLDAREFAAWGAGGLFKEQLGRPSPRTASEPETEPERDPEREGMQPAAPSPVPRSARPVAAIVLAAGRSRRMGRRNKLLETVAGEPMVRHAVRAAVAATAPAAVLGAAAAAAGAAAAGAAAVPGSAATTRGAAPTPGADGTDGGPAVVVVTGHERERVEAALAGFDVAFAHNPDYRAGLGTSLARGVAALPPDAAGALVCLGDMPGVRAEHLERLRAAFDPDAGAAICVATHRGKRGNPVLFAARFFPELCEVEGDVGARHLIGAYADLVREVEMPDDGVLLDIDSPGGLRAYEERPGPEPRPGPRPRGGGEDGGGGEGGGGGADG